MKERGGNGRPEKVAQLWAFYFVLIAEYCQSNQMTMDEKEEAGETSEKGVLVRKSEGK